MTWPEPWPKTKEEVRRWKITDPYDRYFAKRAEVVTELFERDPTSIDAIALAMVSLNALAWYRYAQKVTKAKKRGSDQGRFRLLLTQYCSASFVNRVSILELVRAIRKHPDIKSFEKPIKEKFPIMGMSMARQPGEDPLIADFDAWLSERGLIFPNDFPRYDYASCIFRHYRNSVIHELRIAKGKEAGYFGEGAHATPIYYMNHCGRPGIEPEEGEADALTRFMNEDPVDYMRFGIRPMYLLELLQEAIGSLREWSLQNDHDVFEGADG